MVFTGQDIPKILIQILRFCGIRNVNIYVLIIVRRGIVQSNNICCRKLDDRSRCDLIRLTVVGIWLCTLIAEFFYLFVRVKLIAELLGNSGLIQPDHCRRRGISGTVAYADNIIAGLQNIGCLLLTVRRHLRSIERDLQCLALARSDLIRLGKACQLLVRLFQLACRGREINLDNFLSRIVFAGIGHGSGYCDMLSVRFYRVHHCLKCGVRKSVTKLIRRSYIKGIIVAVSNINTLGVIFLIHIAVIHAPGLGIRKIRIIDRPGSCQFSGRSYLTVQDLHQSIAAPLSGLAHHKHRIDSLDLTDEFCINGAASVDDQDHFVKSIRYLLQICALDIGEFIISRGIGAVSALTGISGQNVNTGIRVRCRLCHHIIRDLDLFRPGGTPETVPRRLLRQLLCFLICQDVRCSRHIVACVCEALCHRYGLSLIHITGSGTAFHRALSARAEYCDVALRCQRQSRIFVLQQNHTLSCQFHGKIGIFLLPLRYFVGSHSSVGPIGGHTAGHRQCGSHCAGKDSGFIHNTHPPSYIIKRTFSLPPYRYLPQMNRMRAAVFRYYYHITNHSARPLKYFDTNMKVLKLENAKFCVYV